MRAVWLAVLVCLIAELAGFVVLHRSTQDYRAPAGGYAASASYR